MPGSEGTGGSGTAAPVVEHPDAAEAPAGGFVLEEEIAQSIGSTLRALRRDRGLTLQEVADRAGLSLAMVSKIENAQASPSLRTLAQLSQALAVPVPIFFRELSDTEDASFVAAGAGIELTRPGSQYGYRYELLAAQLGSRRVLQPYLVTIAADAEPYPLFQHTGSEFIYVLEGALTYRYGSGTYDLGPGDSLLLHGTVRHGPEAFTRHPIRLLSITLTRSDEAIEGL
jgi:transcriptional regulator with XRE-family HTH domain